MSIILPCLKPNGSLSCLSHLPPDHLLHLRSLADPRNLLAYFLPTLQSTAAKYSYTPSYHTRNSIMYVPIVQNPPPTPSSSSRIHPQSQLYSFRFLGTVSAQTALNKKTALCCYDYDIIRPRSKTSKGWLHFTRTSPRRHPRVTTGFFGRDQED